MPLGQRVQKKKLDQENVLSLRVVERKHKKFVISAAGLVEFLNTKETGND
jgi:hypothetical protein